MKKKQLLFVLDTLKTGGAEKSTLFIASRLRSIDATVCTIYEGDDLSSDPDFSGVRIIRLDSPERYAFRKNAKRLRQVIDEVRPDLVVSTIFKANIVTRLAMRGLDIPLLGTFINDDYPLLRFRAGGLKSKAFFLWRYAWDLATVSRNSHIVSNSESIKASNAAMLRYPESKVSVIYRGRPIAEQDEIATTGTAERLRFLNVGRLIERKGQLELIRAFQRALTTYPQLTLQIAGEGSFRPTLERAIAEGGGGNSIQLLGHVGNVEACLTDADVFVLPSHYEGFSGALVEAMLAGKLIICSDIAMNREAITDGDTGLLFACHNEDDLCQKLLHAVEHYDKLKELGGNARAAAIEHFDMEKATARYESLYLQLMNP